MVQRARIALKKRGQRLSTRPGTYALIDGDRQTLIAESLEGLVAWVRRELPGVLELYEIVIADEKPPPKPRKPRQRR